MYFSAYIVLFSLCVSISAEIVTKKSPDSISEQVDEIFAGADELAAQRKQRSWEYLISLPDKDLATLYAKATEPQQAQPSGINEISAIMLEKIKKDRSGVIEQLLKYGTPLNTQDDNKFSNMYNEFVDKLAALGPSAVPAISSHMGEKYRITGHWALAKKGLFEMGAGAVEPLIDLLENPDQKLRENVTYVLSLLGDTRAKNAFLNALEDEHGAVRKYAIEGLIKLGPEAVGHDKLVAVLIEHLEDSTCIRECITGLEKYGDETAIDSLGVIESFYPARKDFKKLDLRYPARRAIYAILKRAGKSVTEVSRQDYTQKESTYEELFAAAQYPNAAVRSCAISWLGQYKDDQTSLFLIERIKVEQNSEVLDQITRTLRSIIVPPKGTIEPLVSPQIMQKAFDAFRLKTAIASPQETKGRIAVIQGCRDMLFAASLFNLPLKNIEQFKKIVQADISSAPKVRTVSYSAVSSIATISPETGESWTPAEKEKLMQDLTPLLDLPNPNIRLIECLGHIGDKRLTPRLIELLGHEDSNIRRFAAYAIGQIGDSQGLPALKNLALTDPYRYENGVFGVREAAQNAIEQINKLSPSEIKDKIKINRNIN